MDVEASSSPSSSCQGRAVILSGDRSLAESCRASRLECVVVGSAYEAAAELLAAPTVAMIVDLKLLTARHVRLLEIARQMGMEMLGVGTLCSAMAADQLSGLRLVSRADLPETEMGRRVERVGAVVGEHGGKITLEDHWGVRKLAYEIEKQFKGDYMLLRFESQGTAVTEIDRYLRLDDKVLRHLVVVDEEWEERNRVAMAKRRQQRSDEDSAES